MTLTHRASRSPRDLLARAKAAEAGYRCLFNPVLDAILVAGADGRYLDANPTATELLGMVTGDLAARESGKRQDARGAERNYNRSWRPWRRGVSSETPGRVEARSVGR